VEEPEGEPELRYDCNAKMKHPLAQESDPYGQYGPRRRAGLAGLCPAWAARARKSGLQDGAFCYQSCSGRTASMRGTFGGEVTFVPGTRRRPTGEPFQARVQPFRLHVPEYMY
ncbi:unnamed protein product, partial [Prorocentrum cordatum]